MGENRHNIFTIIFSLFSDFRPYFSDKTGYLHSFIGRQTLHVLRNKKEASITNL